MEGTEMLPMWQFMPEMEKSYMQLTQKMVLRSETFINPVWCAYVDHIEFRFLNKTLDRIPFYRLFANIHKVGYSLYVTGLEKKLQMSFMLKF